MFILVGLAALAVFSFAWAGIRVIEQDGRHGARDHALLLLTYRHGPQAAEAVGLKLDSVNLREARLWVKRVKNSLSTEQPIKGDELRAIKRYLATREDKPPWLSCQSAAVRWCLGR